MKNLFVILLLAFTVMNSTAQNTNYIPQAINYQAVAKDNQGQPITSTAISLRVSIIHGSTDGAADWVETHGVTTASDGLFEITIGHGTRTGGNMTNFADVDWGQASHYLKMEIDATGGSNYTSPTTIEFCSIPYAFKTGLADSLSGVSTDTLRLMMDERGTCTCTLQDAYDISFGATINTNLNINGDWRPIKFFNVVPSGTTTPTLTNILEISTAYDPDNLDVRAASFETQNTGFTGNNISTAPTVTMENKALGSCLYLTNGFLSLASQSTGYGMALANHSTAAGAVFAEHGHWFWGPSSDPAIFALNHSKGDGGLFRITNQYSQNSSASAVRAEVIDDFPDLVNAQAGSFLVAEPGNNAVAVSVETDGKGLTSTFFSNNTGSSSHVVDMTNTGTGTVLHAYNQNTLANGNNVGHFTLVNSQRCYAVFAEANSNGAGVGSIVSGPGLSGYFNNTSGAPSAFTVSVANSSITGTGILSQSQGNAVWALTSTNTPTNAVYASHSPFAASGGYAGYFNGDVFVTGMINKAALTAFVKNGSDEMKLIYSEESAEYWSTDYGFGQLVNGTATINIEPEFLSTVNCTVPYHIFIQMEGPCNNAGAYVTNKTATSFDVVEQNSGNDCNASFSYTIRAKRKGFEDLRMGTQTQTSQATSSYMQTYFPEIVAENENNATLASQVVQDAMPPNYSFNPPGLSNVPTMATRIVNIPPGTREMIYGPEH